MKITRQFLSHSARYVGGAVLTFLLWMFWLLLCILFIAQLYIATRNEVSVPDFVLRGLESRLAESGIKVAFARATFDPTGRVLVTQARVFLSDFDEPVVTAQGAYVGLNPWMLAIGRFEPREIRIIDGTLQIPSMLSPSGRPEPVVHNLDALVLPSGSQVVVRHVTGRLGALLVSIHGQVTVVKTPGKPRVDYAALVHSRFVEFCRGSVALQRRLNDFEEPALELRLEPSTTRGATVIADLTARGLRLTAPFTAEAKGLHATTELPLLGNSPAQSRLDVTVEQVRLPNGVESNDVSAVFRGRILPAEFRVEPAEVDLAAAHLVALDAKADTISAVARPRDLLHWDVVAVGRVLESALSLSGDADLKARTANLRFSGTLSPHIIDPVSARTHVDVRKYFDFQSLQCELGRAEFGPGWKFQHASAHLDLQRINAYGVLMEEGTANVDVDPTRFYSPEAYARIGENFAHGSYEHVFATHEFRFLLKGQLRPLDISEWFRDWWPRFFNRFSFPVRPPAASVDVHGYWREGRRTTVFVFADADKPVILGQKLARVRTRLFIRPGFYDTMEMMAADLDGGVARGTFTVAANAATGDWRTIDVDGESTVALSVASGMAGELAHPILSPFELASPPTVKARGHFEGPDITGPRHQSLELSATSKGAFSFFHLPLEDVSFTTLLHDDELIVDSTQAKFAGGSVRLHAKVWGAEPERRIGFDANLNDASLGVAVAHLQRFNALRKGLPVPPAGKFVQEKANVRADIAASADGLYGNMLTFHGGGSAVLRGAEIGEVPLFGPLSDLLKFTALRFTTANATFKINATKIDFPEVNLRGANSAIDAHGEYALDRQQLDFRAKVFPFHESGSMIKSVVGVVLSPISNVLEVKLTGTLERPDWAFVIGPTNLFRSLSSSEPTAAAPDAPAAAPAGTAKPAEATTPSPVQPAKTGEALAPKPD